MPNYDVVLKTVPPLRIASRKVSIPTNGEVPSYLGAAYKEAGNYIKQHGAKENGPCLAIWHQAADVYVNEEAEAAIPVDRILPGTDNVKVYELPETQVVSAVHHGAFENFTQLHTVLLKWIEANNYRIVGPYREIYLSSTTPNMPESATEIQYPVQKA